MVWRAAEIAATLEKNRRNWDNHGIDFYQFRFQRSCRCVPEFRREAIVRVRDGSIQHAEYTDNGEVVDPADFGRFLAIDDLFSLIAEALDAQAARIEVSYDPTYGYPTRLFIDRELTMADEEVEYQAADLLPLR